jgi:hypothetical protein
MRPSSTQRQRWRAGLHGRASRRLARRDTNGQRPTRAFGDWRTGDDSESERGYGPATATATATQMEKGADSPAANARTLAVPPMVSPIGGATDWRRARPDEQTGRFFSKITFFNRKKKSKLEMPRESQRCN